MPEYVDLMMQSVDAEHASGHHWLEYRTRLGPVSSVRGNTSAQSLSKDCSGGLKRSHYVSTTDSLSGQAIMYATVMRMMSVAGTRS